MNFLQIAAQMTNPQKEVVCNVDKLNPGLAQELLDVHKLIIAADPSDSLRSVPLVAVVVNGWIKRTGQVPYKEGEK